VLFLGHIVSSAGVHIDPKRIAVVSNLASPKNVEQVRTFLGLVGYYRRFIPNFASISAPLVALTKKASKFHCDAPEQSAFQILQQLLCSAPVLFYPKFDQRFILQTDASDLGLGAVLTQKDSLGQEHVISYASRSLSNREKQYSATEKEALAVEFATARFRAYLLGRPFTLVTDHSALRWLHSVEPKGRIGSVMDLQEYDFMVFHRPGSANGNANALSRLPLQESLFHPGEPTNKGSSTACSTAITPGASLQQSQLADARLSKIIELKSIKFPKLPFFIWAKDPILRVFWHCWDSLHIVNGLLVKTSLVEKGSIPEYSFVIPTSLIDSVLQGIHSTPFSGHLGMKKTLLRTKNRFFWPKMAVQIKDFARNCPVCAQTKLHS